MPTSELKYNEDYYLKNPKRKDKEWANRLIGSFRREWKNIIDVTAASSNMELLNATHSLEDIKDGFKKGKTFTEKNKFASVSVWHRIINVMMAKFIKSAYTPNVEAIDPAARNYKDRDMNMLKNRKWLEGILNNLNDQVGDAPFKIPNSEYEGNVEMFDEMGLDSNSDEDVTFFRNNFHQLWTEIATQELTKALLRHNEFDRHVKKLVKDILAKNAICYQVYASAYTGEIKWTRRKPEEVKAIKGERDDFKDGLCIGYEKSSTVREFLDFVGAEFSFDRESDREMLRGAINFTNGTDYVYVSKDGCWSMDNDTKQRYVSVDYRTMVSSFSVGTGYIEWKSVDGEAEKVNNKRGFSMSIDYDEEVDSKNYSKRTSEYQRTYKSWFISTGTYEQHLFRFGPLFHMISEGAADEYSSFSIHAFVVQEKSAVEIAEPFHRVMDMALNKIIWAINESTPQVEYYNYDSIINLVSKMQPEGQTGAVAGMEGQLAEVMNYYTNNLRRPYTLPEIEGQKFGGNQRLNYKEDGGIDPLAVAMQSVLDWGEYKILSQLGLNALVNTDVPDPKDGFKINQQRVQASVEAAYYIGDMITSAIKDISYSSILIAQDAIEYHKTPGGKLVYEFIEQLIDKDAVDSFRSLKKVPMHRFGFHVEVFNTQESKARIEQEALMALQGQRINEGQYAMIMEHDDPKRARVMLVFYADRMQKSRQKEAALQHERAMELKNAEMAAMLQAKQMDIEGDLKREDVRGYYYMGAHQTVADAALAKKRLDIDTNAQKLSERTDEDIRKLREQENIKNQAPLTGGALVGEAQSTPSE